MKGLRNLMMVGAFCMALGASSFAMAREHNFTGTIPVSGQHTQSELQNMAKITQNDAQQKALDAVKAEKATVTSSKLETRNGYLVYAFEIQVPGKTGTQMVLIDAGNGQVLEHKKEKGGYMHEQKEKEGTSPSGGTSGGKSGSESGGSMGSPGGASGTTTSPSGGASTPSSGGETSGVGTSGTSAYLSGETSPSDGSSGGK